MQILHLAALTLIAAPFISALPAASVPQRRENKCKQFQLFATPFTNSGGQPSYVGNPSCCCAGAYCHLASAEESDAITASTTLNANLGGNFVISGNGGSGTGSYDDRTDSKTYTVASLGAC